MINCFKSCLIATFLSWAALANADNQTEAVSPIFSEETLPFRIQIELADFNLPNGIQSFVAAEFEGKWLFLAGRTNGLHGFDDNPNNFPPQQQNRFAYVVDPVKKTVAARSLQDPGSGLSIQQVDLLSVTSPQYYQTVRTLYITGGYGVDQTTGLFSTKPALTAIDIPGFMEWVTNPFSTHKASHYVRHFFNPLFQVTGGYMAQVGAHATLLVFGQDFKGYYTPSTTGEYTEQVRRFTILDNGERLKVLLWPSEPATRDPNYRRRDLNVVRVLRRDGSKLKAGLVALSGVFTPTDGVWTVPVEISASGKASMADPLNPKTFKQGMNNYACANVGLYSKHRDHMYTILFGGISYGYFADGQFQTDSEFPFTNEVTTVKINKRGHYKQYLMSAQYPLIRSTQSNPGNPLLFGTGAVFMRAAGIPLLLNRVINLDALREPVLLGYIIGGIQSTLPNTTSSSDSAASPYIFKVLLIPVDK